MYYDRLVDDADRSWVFGKVKEIVKEGLDEDFDQLFVHLDADADGKVGNIQLIKIHNSPILFHFTMFDLLVACAFLNLNNFNFVSQVVEDDVRSLMYCDFADPKSDKKDYVEVMYFRFGDRNIF